MKHNDESNLATYVQNQHGQQELTSPTHKNTEGIPDESEEVPVGAPVSDQSQMRLRGRGASQGASIGAPVGTVNQTMAQMQLESLRNTNLQIERENENKREARQKRMQYCLAIIVIMLFISIAMQVYGSILADDLNGNQHLPDFHDNTVKGTMLSHVGVQMKDLKGTEVFKKHIKDAIREELPWLYYQKESGMKSEQEVQIEDKKRYKESERHFKMVSKSEPQIGIALTGDKYDWGHGHTHYIELTTDPSRAIWVTIDHLGVIHHKSNWDAVFDAYQGILTFYQNDYGPAKNPQNLFNVNSDGTINVLGKEDWVVGTDATRRNLEFVRRTSKYKI